MSLRRLEASTVAGAVLGVLMATGCSAIVAPDTTRLGPNDAPDAAVIPGTDAAFPLGTDAAIVPGVDAALPDAHIPGTDAAMPPDAWTPDAFTAPPTEIVPSNVDPALVDRGTVDLTIDSAASFDTMACAARTASSERITQRDGGVVCALFVRQLRITDRGTLRVEGDVPLVILASGDVDIEGTLDVSARGTTPGPGGGAGGTPRAPDGQGITAGVRGGTVGVYADGGGGGGGLCAPGGRGGRGGSAGGGAASAGLTSVLVPLVGGGGGGLGFGGNRPVPNGNAGAGGAGGGTVQIMSRGTLRVRGSILAGGGAGSSGQAEDRYVNWGAGGGGGGGGGILLEADTLRIDATARLLATGGSGGAGSSQGFPFTSGTDGRDSATGLAGGVGGGSYGANGGRSGGGDTTNGGDGGASTNEGGNGGGGGGGAGCIVLRARGGATLPSATLSPSTLGLSLLPAHER